jgi:hypothetical protein
MAALAKRWSQRGCHCPKSERLPAHPATLAAPAPNVLPHPAFRIGRSRGQCRQTQRGIDPPPALDGFHGQMLTCRDAGWETESATGRYNFHDHGQFAGGRPSH